MDQVDLDFSVLNGQTPPTNKLYLGRTDVLNATLVNTTGEPLPLAGGRIQLVFPGQVLTDADVAKLAPKGLPEGWAWASSGQILELTPPAGAMLDAGVPLAFRLENAASSLKKAGAGPLTAKYAGLSVWPKQVSKTLSLESFPTGEPKNLRECVACVLEEPFVYRSYDLARPIVNKLVLNVSNITKGPLITAPWGASSPRISLTVVTGEGPGALTRDASSGADSPLNISPGIAEAYSSRWGKVPGSEQRKFLSWDFEPVKTANDEALGTGERAQLDLTLDGIVTVLPPGHTQLYAQFSNFPGYGDCLFVVDVQKRDPVPGVLSFDTDAATIPRGQGVTLRWSTFAATRVVLEFAEGGEVRRLSSAADGLPLNSLKEAVGLKVTPVVTTTYTLRAYDQSGLEAPGARQVTVTVVQPKLAITVLSPDREWADFTTGPQKIFLCWGVSNAEAVGRLELDPLGVLPDPRTSSVSSSIAMPTDFTLRVYSADGLLADARTLRIRSAAEWLVGKGFAFRFWDGGPITAWAWAYFMSPGRMTYSFTKEKNGLKAFLRTSGPWQYNDGVISLQGNRGNATFSFASRQLTLTNFEDRWSPELLASCRSMGLDFSFGPDSEPDGKDLSALPHMG